MCPVAVAKPSVVVNYGPICISDLRCRSQEAPDVLDDALAEVPARALIPEAQVRLGLELRGGVGELERDGAATELDRLLRSHRLAPLDVAGDREVPVPVDYMYTCR